MLIFFCLIFQEVQCLQNFLKYYIEARAGVTVVTKTYSFSKIMKDYKVGNGFTTKLKGKKIKIIKKCKDYIQVSTENFPKKLRIYSSKKIKVV